MEREIKFYYAIGSRYSYLASTQIDEVAAQNGCTVRWIPVEGFELRSLTAKDPFLGKTLSGQYQSPFRENDIAAWAVYFGVPYREPPSKDGEMWLVNYEFLPLALCAAAGMQLERTAEISKTLFCLMFASETWPVTEPVCLDAIEELGIDRAEFTHVLTEPNLDKSLSELAQEAAENGVFGVPSFLIDDKQFFGNDRLVLLDHYLKTREP